MKDKLFEEMAYNILEDYTRAYSAVDKDTLVRYLRAKFEEYHKQGDVVTVVRCKDCKDYKQNEHCPDDEMVCKCWADWLYTDPDDFCSYGERKEK